MPLWTDTKRRRARVKCKTPLDVSFSSSPCLPPPRAHLNIDAKLQFMSRKFHIHESRASKKKLMACAWNIFKKSLIEDLHNVEAIPYRTHTNRSWTWLQRSVSLLGPWRNTENCLCNGKIDWQPLEHAAHMFHACGIFKVALFTSSIPCRDKCFTRSAVWLEGNKKLMGSINMRLGILYLVAWWWGAIKALCNVYYTIKVWQLLCF